MNAIAGVITSIFNLLVAPFGKTHQTLELVWLSLLTGVLMAFIFKWVQNPGAVRSAKDRLKGRILEMRIYQDDPLLIIKGLGGALAANMRYLGTMLVPFVVLLIPVLIVFIQMDERYGRAPLPDGTHTVLSVQLRDGLDPYATSLRLHADDGLVNDAKPVRVAGTGEIDWRLRVDRPGTYTATLQSDGGSYEIPVVAETSRRMIGHQRSASFLEPLLHPALPAIPSGSPLQKVHLSYPGASYPFLWWNIHWILIFIIYSALSALALKFVIKFEI